MPWLRFFHVDIVVPKELDSGSAQNEDNEEEEQTNEAWNDLGVDRMASVDPSKATASRMAEIRKLAPPTLPHQPLPHSWCDRIEHTMMGWHRAFLARSKKFQMPSGSFVLPVYICVNFVLWDGFVNLTMPSLVAVQVLVSLAQNSIPQRLHLHFYFEIHYLQIWKSRSKFNATHMNISYLIPIKSIEETIL